MTQGTRRFYEELSSISNKYEISFPQKSCFVLNRDEIGFCIDPKMLKPIGVKRVPLSSVSGGSGRESTSVLATISVDGH